MSFELYKNNLKLNRDEILRKEISLRSKPIGLGIALTSRCGLKCIMCRAWEEEWEIPDKTAEEVFSLLPYLSRLYWQGGEVFFSGHFIRLFREAVKYPHIHQELVTSGLQVNEKLAELITSAPVNIIYSIDGFTPETYEKIRVGGSFDKMKKSAEMINRYKLKNTDSEGRPRATTSINCTVMLSNYRDIPLSADFAADAGFDDLTLTPVDHIRDDENIFLHKNTEALDFIQNAIPNLRERARERGISFHCLIQPLKPSLPLSDPGEEEKTPQKADDSAPPDCLWPWQHLFIDMGGIVKPHCVCRAPLGNTENMSIEEIWNSDIMKEYRRRVISGDMKGFCSENCIRNLHQKELFRIRDPLEL